MAEKIKLTWYIGEGENPCCCCKRLNLDILMRFSTQFSPGDGDETPDLEEMFKVEELHLGEQLGDEDANCPDGGKWCRHAACLRWLCRRIDVEGSDGSKTIRVCEATPYGGPTTNDRDLWEDLILPGLGEATIRDSIETETGCYLYVITFYGWAKRTPRGDGTRENHWVSDDYYYDVIAYRLKPPDSS